MLKYEMTECNMLPTGFEERECALRLDIETRHRQLLSQSTKEKEPNMNVLITKRIFC